MRRLMLTVLMLTVSAVARAEEKPTLLHPCGVPGVGGIWFQEMNCESRAVMRTDCPYPGVRWEVLSTVQTNVGPSFTDVLISVSNDPVARVRGYASQVSTLVPAGTSLRRRHAATSSVREIRVYFTLRASDNCGNYGFLYGSVGNTLQVAP